MCLQFPHAFRHIWLGLELANPFFSEKLRK
jgi:hypothetical protein